MVNSVKCYPDRRKITLFHQDTDTNSTDTYSTDTNRVPLGSVYQVPSYEPNLTFLAWFLRDLAYLSMLFILEVLCTTGSAEHLKNK